MNEASESPPFLEEKNNSPSTTTPAKSFTRGTAI